MKHKRKKTAFLIPHFYLLCHSFLGSTWSQNTQNKTKNEQKTYLHIPIPLLYPSTFIFQTISSSFSHTTPLKPLLGSPMTRPSCENKMDVSAAPDIHVHYFVLETFSCYSVHDTSSGTVLPHWLLLFCKFLFLYLTSNSWW